jgi:dimethylargininase
MTLFKSAIVRKPGPSLIEGITTASLGKPDYKLALIQHDSYVKTLEKLGLQVEILEADDSYPDSVFIEDVALCTPEFALITMPGAVSRKGEIAGMKEILGKYFNAIEEITPPGTLEAGDVMMAGNHFFIGLSERTNQEGAQQLINILSHYGMTGSAVPLRKLLHLKSGAAYLENNNMLVCDELYSSDELKNFNRILVDRDEVYSANSLWINDTVLVPEHFPGTKKKLENAGYRTIALDMSEFRKLDGGLSCLSLRF